MVDGRTCSGASFWAWGGRAQSAVREMNDSRYYQPLLPASSASRASIDHASAQLLLRTHPPSQPALSILSPPPPPRCTTTTTTAALRRVAHHPGKRRERESERERERVRACESDSRRPQSSLSPNNAAAQHSIAPSCTCFPLQLKESSAIGRAAALKSSQHLQPPSTLPANQPADRE